MEQVTFAKGNNQLLYFTSSSLLADDRGLVYIGDGDGHPNLYHMDLATGEVRQLTFQNEGVLRSYVYFDGTPYRGFGKASVSLAPGTGNVYYLQGRQLMRVNAHTGESRALCTLPGDQVTGFTHVDSDDELLCVPTIHERAFEVEGDRTVAIDRRVQQAGLSSRLRVYRAATGEAVSCERVPKGWVTHVQFSPKDRNMILYNHEWPADCGVRRMWLWNGGRHRRLRTGGEGRAAADWVCHEMWEPDGRHIIYHGRYQNGACFVGRVNEQGAGGVEIPFPPGYTAYGHFTTGAEGLLVTDGYYTIEGEAHSGHGQWIALLRPDWDKRHLEWTPLCRHGSSWDCQCSHPHPIMDHGGRYVYFTSDIDGSRQIYRVATGL